MASNSGLAAPPAPQSYISTSYYGPGASLPHLVGFTLATVCLAITLGEQRFRLCCPPSSIKYCHIVCVVFLIACKLLLLQFCYMRAITVIDQFDMCFDSLSDTLQDS